MSRFWIAGILAVGILIGLTGRRIFGRYAYPDPKYGEIGVLALCTIWYVAVLLYGTPLERGSSILLWAVVILTGATGIFWGVLLGWSRFNKLKRWIGYGVVIGSMGMLLLA